MECNEALCLDKKENTKVIFGNVSMNLDEFDDIIEKNPKLKKKMKELEKKLESY